MRDVPMAEFKDNASAFVAAAKAGEDIIITRHGKPMAKLTMVDGAAASVDVPTAVQRDEERSAARREEARMARQREAVHALFEEGRIHRAKYGSVSTEQVVEWIKEDQR